MQTKQKVTLYLPPELHHRLKIRAAIDSEPMSELTERALIFYLAHPEVVDEVEALYGQTHQVYACPECATPVVIKDGDLMPLRGSSVVESEQVTVTQVAQGTDQEELVPCLH